MTGHGRDRFKDGLKLVVNGMKTLHDILRSYFITGVILVVPAFVTLFIIYQLFIFADGILGSAVSGALGVRIPGFGLIATALLFVVAGRIAQNVIGQRILTWVDRSLESLPVVRSLYVGIKQVSDVVLQQHKGEFKRVVLVEYPKEDSWVVAFVTGDFPAEVTEGFGQRSMLCVFVPTTPNPTSGFLLIVDRTKIMEMNLSIEEAMKLVISGGLVKPTAQEIVQPAQTDEEFTIPH
ncbi:DUF502 domain-containing protein [Candidatus Ozemobacteraceae bacterium]|nr:DUF502 domain-containing protein [Candidatus Ozemobacteraceae bacterium]